jgi:DNA polymerase I-like protein with 3'-5' exonuclease and polymerase domains
MFDLPYSLKELQKLYAEGVEKVALCRQETKSYILGWTYRMGARKLEEVRGIPYQRGKAALKGLDNAFPGIPTWWRTLEDTVLRNSSGSGWGWLENAWGRRRYFFPDDVPAFCNFFPQSSAADILFDAMEKIEEHYAGKLPKLLLTCHDEVVLETPDATLTAAVVRKIMERPITPLKGMVVPTEIFVGSNWAKAREDNPEGVRKIAA